MRHLEQLQEETKKKGKEKKPKREKKPRTRSNSARGKKKLLSEMEENTTLFAGSLKGINLFLFVRCLYF